METTSIDLQAELNAKQQELLMHVELLIRCRSTGEKLLEEAAKLQPFLLPEGKERLAILLNEFQECFKEEQLLLVEKKFDSANARLYQLLETKCPDITKNEKRLCAYLKLNHSAADVARITNRSLNSVNVGLARLRAKLDLSTNKTLKAFLHQLLITPAKQERPTLLTD